MTRPAVAALFALTLAVWGTGCVSEKGPTNNVGAKQQPIIINTAVERLMVAYASGTFSLAERMTVRKRIPSSDELPRGHQLVSGFWYELQGAEGEVLYRRIIENPLRLAFEGPRLGSTGPSEPLLDEAILDSTTFAVLVPKLASASSLVLFSSPLEAGHQAEPAREVGRLDLEAAAEDGGVEP